jgi:hypothetical protein
MLYALDSTFPAAVHSNAYSPGRALLYWAGRALLAYYRKTYGRVFIPSLQCKLGSNFFFLPCSVLLFAVLLHVLDVIDGVASSPRPKQNRAREMKRTRKARQKKKETYYLKGMPAPLKIPVFALAARVPGNMRPPHVLRYRQLGRGQERYALHLPAARPPAISTSWPGSSGARMDSALATGSSWQQLAAISQPRRRPISTAIANCCNWPVGGSRSLCTSSFRQVVGAVA